MGTKMKESGIPWIGMIPDNWEVKRLKEVFVECKEKSLDGAGELLSLSQYTGVQQKKDTDKAGTHESETYEGYNVVHKGQLVMNIMLAWNGSYAISDYDGIISPAYCVFDFRIDCAKQYFHFLLRTNGYPSAFKTLSRGIIDSRLRLYPEQFYTFPTIFPPLPTQQRIADYLDRKCAEIDELAALQETMIAELKRYKQSVITEAVTGKLKIESGNLKVENGKMKDSGVEWIGEIPSTWRTIRLKFLCTIQTGNQDTQDAIADGEYPFYVRSPLVEHSNKFSFEGEGILMAGDGAGAGRVFHHVFGKYAVHQRVYRLANFTSIHSDYLFYFLSSLFCKEMDRGSAQSTVPSVRLPMLQNFCICIPTTAEQRAIADYLDRKCAEIDELITIKQQKIEALKEYKKSVIFEYVTGKREVER